LRAIFFLLFKKNIPKKSAIIKTCPKCLFNPPVLGGFEAFYQPFPVFFGLLRIIHLLTFAIEYAVGMEYLDGL
jgi:hypothetical protein